jgi:hypothetical protein
LRGKKVENTKRGRKFERLNVVAAQHFDEKGNSKILLPLCYKHTTTADFFESWFEGVLWFCEGGGYTIVMDNAAFHRKTLLYYKAGFSDNNLIFLPPYSPDFNKIEHLWANMKKKIPDFLSENLSLDSAVYKYLMSDF